MLILLISTIMENTHKNQVPITSKPIPSQTKYGYIYQNSKYGYISTNAFVVVQLSSGMWIRKNL